MLPQVPLVLSVPLALPREKLALLVLWVRLALPLAPRVTLVRPALD